MSRVETVAADTPFGERLRTGFGYPVRGAALPTCTVMALLHYVGLLPSYIGALASALVWAATWRYAADCLLHTAHGYADPPDVGSDGNDASGWGLTAIHLLVVGLCVIAIVFFPRLLWPVLIVVASVSTALLPRLLALPLFAFAYTYLIVLAFHLMGAMIHQRHERFGLEPEAPKLARAGGQDADETLLAEVDVLSRTDPAAATALLVARMQDRVAPASLHVAYRRLLQRQNLRDGLLVHGQIWIAALIAQGESRRALGLLQECCGIDAGFIPDDPRTCGELADLAARLGMSRIALHLCNGFLAHWPRDPQAPHYGLLAARKLAEHADQRADATALLDRLSAAWPEHPLRAEIDAQRRLLGSPA